MVKTTNRTIMIVICTFFMFAFLNSPALAITLSLTPPSSDGLVGDSILVEVVVSGLENDPPPPLNLAAFEFDVNFDTSILEFNSYTLGIELGDLYSNPDIAWDLTVIDPEDGMIHFSELSWLWDFTSQPDSFTLATLCFTGIQAGNSDLSFSNVLLSDDSWPAESLEATSGTGSVNIVTPAPAPTPVPEPGTLFLMAIGILGLGGLIRKITDFQMPFPGWKAFAPVPINEKGIYYFMGIPTSAGALDNYQLLFYIRIY